MESKGLYKAMGELDLLFNYIETYLASKQHTNVVPTVWRPVDPNQNVTLFFWLLHSFAFNPLFSVVWVLPVVVVACWTDVFVILRLLFLSWGQVNVLRPYWVLHIWSYKPKLSLMKLWYLFFLSYIICIFVFMMTNIVLLQMNKWLDTEWISWFLFHNTIEMLLFHLLGMGNW